MHRSPQPDKPEPITKAKRRLAQSREGRKERQRQGLEKQAESRIESFYQVCNELFIFYNQPFLKGLSFLSVLATLREKPYRFEKYYSLILDPP
jgi:hypothetical protein